MEAAISKLLNGRRIWVTRPLGQCENLCRLIEEAGGEAVRFPVIEIVPVRQQRVPAALSREIQASQLIIFISRNAVEYADSALPEFYQIIAGKQILAIGDGTRTKLHERGISNVVCPDYGIGSEALLEQEQLRPEVLAGQSILVVRGVGGRDKLAETLEQADIVVNYLEVYARRQPGMSKNNQENVWRDTPPDAIVVTSVEGLHNLVNMTPATRMEKLLQTPLALMSKRIQSVALTLGFTGGSAVVTKAGDDELLQATISIFENGTV